MKALFLATAAAGIAAAASGTASAIPVSIGNPLVNACYESAVVERSDGMALSQCTQALRREATTSGDARVATLVNRGILQMLRDDSAGALRDFNAALALDPAQPEAWLGKAVESWKAGNDRDAVSFANRALRLRTEKPELAYYTRGLANERLGNVNAAYADLKRAHALAPQWAEPTMQLSRYRVVSR
jgi:tetratricopeptide (TPR) repeat protein